jgi:hypothetical protein
MRMLWTAEAKRDEILKKGGTEETLLQRYRGINEVDVCRRYLGLS